MLGKARSTEEMELLAVKETNPIKKKVLYAMMFPMKDDLSTLPGELWSTGT